MTQGHEDGKLEELEDDILKLYCIISCMPWDAGPWCTDLINKNFVLEELTRIIKGKPEYKLGDKEKAVFFDIKHKKENRKYNTGLNNMFQIDEDILNLMENVRVLQKKNNEYEKRINVLEDGIINIKVTLPPKTMNFGELTRFKLDDGWFSVHDRLPDEGEVVLVFGSSIDEWDKKEKHHVAVCEIVQHRWFEKEETPQKISHWRHLPHPPELSTPPIIQKQPVANNSTNQV